MSQVLFIADLHLGHRTVLRHAGAVPGAFRGGTTPDEHDEWVLAQCLSVAPCKRTVWWILGDVAMDIDKLPLLERLPGKKRLVLGNHDLFDAQVYLKYFERVAGIVKKYRMWLTHAPMHSDELYGLPNIHGHCHRGGPHDARYFNAAIDWIPGHVPWSLEQLRARFPKPASAPTTSSSALPAR